MRKWRIQELTLTKPRFDNRFTLIESRRFDKGFTLIELLVVIAIIAILAAILFPVFTSAKEAGKRSACLSNLRQISTAFDLYLSSSSDRYPPAVRPKTAGVINPLFPYPAVTAGQGWLTWDSLIFPYTKSRSVYKCPADGYKRDNVNISGNTFPGEPRSYSMNDQVFRKYTGTSPIERAYTGMMRSEPPRASRFVLVVDWFGMNAAGTQANNKLGSESYVMAFNVPGAGQQEHNFKKGNNYLFFDGHVRYADLGVISGKDNYYFDVQR